MKRILIILITIVCSIKISLGQTDSSVISFFINDTILNKIFTFLPPEWIIIKTNNQIIFQRTDSIYLLDNYHNDTIFKKSSKAEKIEYIKSHGNKSKSKIVLRYEDKWNYTKILTTKNNNNIFNQKLQRLPEKYKILSLYNKELSTKFNPVYIGTTEKEKDAIKKYEKERSEILSEITSLPNYNSEKYSFFLISKEGYFDSVNYIYPEDASLQLYKILSLFYEYAGR